MTKGPVGEWLLGHYLKWQLSTGEKQTVGAFADHLGVDRDTFYKWSNGVRVPTGDSLTILASKLGPEIYDLAGVPRPDPRLQVVIENWGKAPDELRNETSELFARVGERQSDRRRRPRVVEADRE